MLQKIIYIILIVGFAKSVIAQTYVSGFISGASVWTELDCPYIIENDMTIQREATLIIEAGTEIVIADDKLISVKGSLICEGMPGKPVKFNAQTNYWGGIYIDRTAKEVRIKFTDFYSGGRNSYTQNSVILINEAEVFIEYSNFLNSYSYGITSFRDGYADMGGGLLNSRGHNTFTGFSHNRWAIVNKSKIELHAKNNCWDSEPSLVIYDKSRNDAVGEVNYEPVSNNCEPQKPDIAELIFPPDSSKDIPVFFNLKWHKLKDISYYQLQFSDEEEFAIPKLDINHTDSIYTVNNLKYGERYFWRVRGVNFAGNGMWSDTYTFVTYDTAKPKKTKLLSPADNALLECEIFFEWDELQKADTYNLIITTDETIIDTNIKTNFLSLNKFKNNDIIRWKVRGENRNGYGKWSDERKFTIMDAFFTDKTIQYNCDNLKSIINSPNSTELIFSDSLQTTIYNITESSSHILEYPVDNYTKVFLNQNDDYDIVYSHNKQLNIIFDDLTEYKTNASGFIRQIKISDLNNDGINEIICKSIIENAAMLEIFELQNEQLRIYDVSIALSVDSDFFVVDADIDGDNDIITLNQNSIQTYINTEGEFELSENELFISNAENPYVYDFNQDGYLDIILNEDGGIRLISNNKGTFFKDSLILNSDYKLKNVSDLNNSGKIILLVSDSENQIYKYDMKLNLLNEFNIVCENIELIKYNADIKTDIIADSVVFINNICSYDTELSKPENLRYSFINENSIMLEWDRSKINYANNYNLIYEITLKNNENNNTYNFNTNNNFYIINNPEDADYDWKVRAVYMEFYASEYSFYNGLYTKNALPKPPQSWDYTNKTGLNTTILLKNKNSVEIQGLIPEYGDALGMFFIRDTSLICGGYSYFNSEKVILTAWGDNNQTPEIKDGFDYTEEFRFKYWDASEEIEIPVNVEFEKGIGWFKPDTLTEIKKISPLDTTEIIIQSGMWNYVSSSIVPFEPFFKKFEGMQDKIVIDIENKIFEKNRDELKHWNTAQGYKIFSDADDTIKIYGSRIHPEYHPFKLKKHTWYLLPAIVNFPTHADTALKSIYNKIIMLKDEEGKVIAPKHKIQQFQYLQPNKSYEIILSEDSEFVLFNEYADMIDTASDNNSLIPDNPIVQNSGNNATLMAVFDDFLQGEITVLAGEKIVGVAKVTSDTVIIAIKGMDVLKNIIGAVEGEKLRIIYSVNQGYVYEVPLNNIYNELNKQYESTFQYSQNSFYSITIDIDKILSVSKERKIDFRISPIPVENELYITSSDIISSIEIIDLSGLPIFANNNPSYNYILDMSNIPNGVYFIKAKINDTILLKKIIIKRI